MDVSPATVAKAYQELRQRGLVATAGRHGTRVRPARRSPVAVPRCCPRRCPAAATSAGQPDPRLLPRSARTWPRSPPRSDLPAATRPTPCCPTWPPWPATGSPPTACRPARSPSPAVRSTASNGCSPPTCAPATRWRWRIRAGPTCST
ncbi:hypothetical protein V2I01_23735 [Micromonospora sp. BRA006-A]|nr:hypothetical protein [Micromonospora sp. BRA006-A]